MGRLGQLGVPVKEVMKGNNPYLVFRQEASQKKQTKGK